MSIEPNFDSCNIYPETLRSMSLTSKEKTLAKINELEKEIVNLKKIVQSANFDKKLPVNFLDACHVTGRDFGWINSLEENGLSFEEVNYIKVKTIFDALNKADGGFVPNWDDLLQEKWVPRLGCGGLKSTNTDDWTSTYSKWFALQSKEMCDHANTHFGSWFKTFLTGRMHYAD
jgi:hypothetical protein